VDRILKAPADRNAMAAGGANNCGRGQ